MNDREQRQLRTRGHESLEDGTAGGVVADRDDERARAVLLAARAEVVLGAQHGGARDDGAERDRAVEHADDPVTLAGFDRADDLATLVAASDDDDVGHREPPDPAP